MEEGEKFIKKKKKKRKSNILGVKEPLNCAVYNRQLSWPNGKTQPS
jgi:hypothetical protein